jgi:adenine deaminase
MADVIQTTKPMLELQIDQAMGRLPADLVVRNARILNLVTGELQPGDIALCGSTIVGTLDRYQGREEIDAQGRVAVPGLIDSHVHCESTLVTPGEFDRCVLPHGVTTAICDPHEIANVLGMAGLEYFLESATGMALDLRVQLSSCVPATHLETSGARLTAADLVRHRDHPQVIGLAEFMNVPGVLNKDPECMEKLAAFQGKHIDGHSPLLSGLALNAYLSCGIRNCHEVTNLAEGREKLAKGMQVLIREGSVSKDLSALTPLIQDFTSPFLGLCTDDRNPLDIHEEGHLDFLVRRAIALGAPVAAVYRAASWSAARGFGLTDRGLIAPGYLGDFLLLDDLESCTVHTVFRRGKHVTPDTFRGRALPTPPGGNTMLRAEVSEESFRVPANGSESSVIGIIPGKILTDHLRATLPVRNGLQHADPENDLLKICVLERHGRNGNIGRGFVKGFGFRRGALASSVGHDSHNLCVVGTNDRDMAIAVNRLLALGGGFVAVENENILAELALPFAGLMSLEPFETVTHQLYALRVAAGQMGCRLQEPFLHLAFLPLPVIPHLKITDMGLVDVDRFQLLRH